MAKLVIVESPAKAKTINKYLGRDYRVRASMGHVRDLPKSKMGVDIEHDFAPDYKIIPDRKKVLTELKKLLKDADEIFLATDLDREGEAIAWHLAEALKLPREKVRRVIFNEITKNAIRKAFDQPLQLDQNKVDAQQARRILDRIVGYQLSPLLWSKIRRGLSAGRVQSVAVRLIVEREREIESFKAEEYWEIDAELAPVKPPAQGPKQFHAQLAKLDGQAAKITNQPEADKLKAELEGAPFVVGAVTEKERLLPPPPPFNTSSLQQQASIQLHFSGKKTMLLAQQLYEGVELGAEGSVGLITYMRTDSLRVSDQALGEVRELIGQKYADCLPEKPNVYKSGKDAQGAHEAVRPSEVARTPEAVAPFLERDQLRLYDLIWRRFVASQMLPGRLSVTDVSINAGRATFETQGRRMLFDGHQRLSGQQAMKKREKTEESDEPAEKSVEEKYLIELPPLTPGEELKLLGLEPSQHFTKPPPRYSEASLVKTLEKLGIGRPSTYAPIISTVQARHYVKLQKRQFFATDLGKLVTDQLVQHFGDIMDVKFTSHMEDRLDEVEESKVTWLQALREFYTPFSADLKKAEATMQRPEPEQTEYKCTQCGKPMLKRWSRSGPFLGCAGYPECRFTQPLDAEGKPAVRAAPEATDEKCEKCGAPMVKRVGRFGPFLSCSAYPKCKNAKNLETDATAIPDELKSCDKCGKPMAVKRSRRGPFLGCTGYPECKNAKPLPKAEPAAEAAKEG